MVKMCLNLFGMQQERCWLHSTIGPHTYPNFLKPIPNILNYHVFRVKSDRPGIVELQEFSDSQVVDVNIFKANVTKESLDGLPKLTVISGLSLQRQWYLHDNIRQHCKSTLAADLTCLKPSQPKEGPSSSARPSELAQATEETSEPPCKKRVITCSTCHQKGHTKRTCPKKS